MATSLSSCNGEDEDCGDQVEDGEMFAGRLIAQLRDDSSAAEEHCKGTFCQEGNASSQDLGNIILNNVCHIQNESFSELTITFS